MYEDVVSNWLAGSNPLAMPAAGAPAASSFFGSYNPYDPNNSASQKMDMLAQTQRFSGVPMYKQVEGYMPQMTPEVQALWQKKQAYNALSEPEKQLARTTGNGYFTNEDQFNLENNTIGNKSMNFDLQAQYNRWTDRFNDQLAWNRLNEDNGNQPSFAKQVAADTLNNHTWASSTINDQTKVARPEGNQLERIVTSQMNHGIDPGQMVRDDARAHDWWYDQLHPVLNALQTNSGTRAGAGMAGQGSGNLQSFSMVDPNPPDLGWGNRGGGLASANNWGGGVSSVPRPANNPWGTQEAYDAGYHPPTPFKNNSLLGSTSQQPGVTNSGATAIATLPNLYGPGRGSWTANKMGQLPQNGNSGFSGPTTVPTYGQGGPLRFADPSKSGNDYTLQDMPGYHPEQGSSASGTGWRGTLRQGSVYGGSPEEGYKNPDLNKDWLNSVGTSQTETAGKTLGGTAKGNVIADVLSQAGTQARQLAGQAAQQAAQWGNNTFVDAVQSPFGQWLTSPQTAQGAQQLIEWNNLYNPLAGTNPFGKLYIGKTLSGFGSPQATGAMATYADMHPQPTWQQQLNSMQKY